MKFSYPFPTPFMSLIAATLLVSVLQADTPTSLSTVTVTAPDTPERDDLKPQSVTNLYRTESTMQPGVETFTRTEIEAYSPRDIFDLLDKASGINLTYQGRRSPYNIEERGGGNLTYILDGAILPPSTSRILQKIPMAAIEEIQIIRGSTSLSVAPSITVGASSSGSGLNTGFVIIRTKQPSKTEGVISGYLEKTESLPTADGESLYVGTRFGSNLSGLGGYIGGVLARYDRPSVDSRFDGSDADSGMITGGLTYGRFNLNLMGYKDSGRFEMQRGITLAGTLANDRWYYDPLKTDIFSADMGMQWNENHTTLASVFKTKYRQNEHNENFATAAASTRHYEEETSGYSLRHNIQYGNTLIQLGGQIINSTGFGANLYNAYSNYDTTITGWSASAEQKLFDGALVLNAGYRQDTKHIDTSSTSVANNDVGNGADMAPARIFALGARWQIADAYALSGRYYNGDQGTSGDYDLKTATGTPLHAEKQNRIEITAEASPVRYFRPALTWFDVQIDNAKTETSQTYTVNGLDYYYFTEYDTHGRGIELALKGDIGPNTSYAFSWTRMIDDKTTKNGITTNEAGAYSPENLYSALISHKWENLRANLSAKKVSSWYLTQSPAGLINAPLGDYTRVDANIAGDFRYRNQTYTAKLYARNLGNEHYSTKYVTGYYPDRGRVVGLELSMAF
ncbi:MAG: TonB-dependent receptor plug domain-containing protein [Sulfuricurvum sp.]